MKCACAACLLSSALELLHGGPGSMAMRLLEQALRSERWVSPRTPAPYGGYAYAS
jgi:hypothetical protein